ncbi:golgin subfamily A member 6-like protein 24 [Palaemon carinicauda]|uniref:golgin subfamily A member 6-like protein 24 n=1 Tax=Palaemon carinicauda TaxID=392227 RepID=UPI0035B5BBC6
MAGLLEHQEFLDNLWRFLSQIWQKEFPCPQLLGDFRRRSVVDGIVSLKKKLENLAEENAALQKQLQEMQVQKSCNQFPIKQSLQSPEFRRLLQKHIEENIKLHENIITLRAENGALMQEILDLKNQLEKHEEMARFSKKKEDNEHLEDLLRKLEDREKLEIAALNHKVDMLEEKIEAIHLPSVSFMQASEIQTLITGVQIEIVKMREDLRNLKNAAETNVEEQDRRQARQLDDYEKLIEELKIEVRERSLQRAALIGQENILKENVRRIEGTNRELVIQIADLQAQLLDKEREVSELKKDESRMKSVAEKCSKEKEGLIEKLNEKEKQIAELKVNLEKKSVERAEMNGHIENLKEKVQLMEKTNDELGIQIALLQTQLMDKERQVYELRKERNRQESNAEKEIRNLKDRVEKLMKENEDLGKQYELGCTREINHLREQIVQLKMENEKINNLKIDKLKENAKLQGVIDEKNNKISRQKWKIDDLRAEIRHLRNKGHKRTTKEVELQGNGLHGQIETPKLDKNLEDEFTKENPSQEQANPSESEAEEETEVSEDIHNLEDTQKNWKQRIAERLGKGLHLDQKANPSQEQANPSESEAEEEREASEDIQNVEDTQKNWKQRIAERLEKGLHLDQKAEPTGKEEWTD